MHPRVHVARLTPTEAELHITLRGTGLPANAELRGRLMGPMCRYSTTIEVAYPIKPLAPSGRDLRGRVVIPEPSWWDPVSPFLYRGPAEIWAEGKSQGSLTVSTGLRHAVMDGETLILNGKPQPLQRAAPSWPTEPALTALRNDGVTVVELPVDDTSPGVWTYADRVGLLVMGQLPEDLGEAARLLGLLWNNPSALGYRVPAALASELEGLKRLAPADRIWQPEDYHNDGK